MNLTDKDDYLDLSHTTTSNDIHAGAGNDIVYGGQSADYLYGDDGHDGLAGGGGNDYLYGGNGNDYLLGGAGNDLLLGGAGADEYYFSAEDGQDTVYTGETGLDTLEFDFASNEIRQVRQNGNHLIIDYGVNDRVTVYNHFAGQAIGNIRFTDKSFSAAELLSSHIFYVTAYLTAGDDYRTFSSNNDLVYGGFGFDNIRGGNGHDRLYGEAGNDVLYGDGGDDILDGGTGNDTLYGGVGANTYVLRSGDGLDTIYGTSKADTLRFADISTSQIRKVRRVGDDMIIDYGVSDSVTIKNHFTSGSIGTFQFANSGSFPDRGISATLFSSYVTPIHLSDGNDVSRFGDWLDTVWAGAGNDVVYGGAGSDTLLGQDGNDILFGEADNDYLFGHAGNDTLYGGRGDDRLNGGADIDTYVIYANEGHDTITYDYKTATDGNDILHLPNISYGQPRQIRADNGNLIIDFGNSSITLERYFSGARHIGTVKFSDHQLSWSDLMRGDALYLPDGGNNLSLPDASAAVYTGSDGDRVSGSHGNDRLFGGAGDDTLAGNAGDDVLYGGDGDDLLDGGGNNDTLSGDAGNDTLYGDEGDDTLHGGNGNDMLSGGAGNDALFGDAGNDTLLGDEGDNTLSGGDGNDVLIGSHGNDLLIGGRGNDRMQAGAGINTYEFNIGDGQDSITGLGEDHLRFNLSVNQIRGIRYSDADLIIDYGASDSVTITNYGTCPTIKTISFSDISYQTAQFLARYPVHLGNGGETATLSPYNDVVYGGNGNDRLYGMDGTDSLRGGDGNDNIFGGNGNDYLYGDNGLDLLAGGTDNDWLSGGDGNDTLRGDEGNDQLYGGAGSDTLYGGAGDDWLYAVDSNWNSTAGASTDHNRLDGGQGSDHMQGSRVSASTYSFRPGDGNDYVSVSNTQDLDTLQFDMYRSDIRNVQVAYNQLIIDYGVDDRVTIDSYTYPGQGIGRISFFGGSYSLADFLSAQTIRLTDDNDNLYLYSSPYGLNIEAGAGDDSIMTGSGNNWVNGGLGNDSLTGGEGTIT